jgi:hypothetical protein
VARAVLLCRGMFRILQRMDDTQPRHASGGGSLSLLPVTVLAEANEEALEALAGWARGLDWLQPLFAGHRHRLSALHFDFAATAGKGLYPRPAIVRAALEAHWRDFVDGDLTWRLAPRFGSIWQAAGEGAAALALADAALDFTGEEAARSRMAGRLLLERLQGARHLGRLGRYRAAWQQGRAPGHFYAAWAAVAHCFQIGLAAAAAEYLRLEWQIAAARLPCGEAGMVGLAAPVAAFLKAAGVPVLVGFTEPPSSSAGESPDVLP